MTISFLHGLRSHTLSVFLLFAFLSILLRFFSFFPSVIDHDESTYLEIARQMLAGKTLYVDYIDIKPPGIFLILAGFQAVFGYSIFVLRLLVSLWVAMTGLMVFKTARILIRDDRASFAAGIIYIFFISTWSFYGISITPEIFFNLFTISALYVLLRYGGTWKYLAAGVLAGLGFLIKYFVLMDFMAFLIFFLMIRMGSRHSVRHIFNLILPLLLAGIGFILPFALANLYYYQSGNFDAFISMIYLAPFRYPSEFNLLKMMKFLLDFHVMFLPVFFFFYYTIFDRNLLSQKIRETKSLIYIWVPLAVFAVILSGTTFGHYTIQLMLPVSLMAGLFFHSQRHIPGFLQKITIKKTGAVLIALLIILITIVKLEYIIRRDIPREVAGYLKTRLHPEDRIYTGNYHHVIYYLLKKDSPTPYIHRSLLVNERHLYAFQIDQEREFRKLMAVKPEYIIIEREYPVELFRDFITENYILEKEFENGVKVFRGK